LLNNATIRTNLKRTGFAFIGLLLIAVIAMSFVELWVIYGTDKIPGFGAVQVGAQGLPGPSQRGAFLILDPSASARFPSTALELLATTEPGVVDAESGAHVYPSELKSVVVQSAVVGGPAEYRVYPIGEQTAGPVKAVPLPGGRAMMIAPESGVWAPGNYIVDVPADGMFGGRTYYQFYIDAEK
jgi:hypothetical protein